MQTLRPGACSLYSRGIGSPVSGFQWIRQTKKQNMNNRSNICSIYVQYIYTYIYIYVYVYAYAYVYVYVLDSDIQVSPNWELAIYGANTAKWFFSTMIKRKRDSLRQQIGKWIKSFRVTADPHLIFSDSETMHFGGLIDLTHPHCCITWDNHPNFWDEDAWAFVGTNWNDPGMMEGNMQIKYFISPFKSDHVK